MTDGEPVTQNAVCIGNYNTANIFVNEIYQEKNPHLSEECFVICWVDYLEDDKSIELYFNEKKKWVVNNINKAKKFTLKDAIKELYFLNKTAGYGLEHFYRGELQLIDLYIYYDEDWEA